jgi:hypothetical protein
VQPHPIFTRALLVVLLVPSACGGVGFSHDETELGAGGPASDGGFPAEAQAGGSGVGGDLTGAGGSTASGGGGTGGLSGVGGSETGGTAGAPQDASVDASPPLSCQSPSQCPAPQSVCAVATCSSQMCGTASLPAGPAPKQTPADCKRVVCTSNGIEAIVADDTDADDGNECTVDTCMGGVATHTVSPGARCGGTKYCDASGACVDCYKPINCPVMVPECYQNACRNGKCMVEPSPSGTLCNGQTDQCNGAGSCVDCVNNGGCAECCVCSSNHCVATP